MLLQTYRGSPEPTNRQEGDLAILYSVTKCLPGSEVSCVTGIQIQYSTFDVQINSDFQFSVNGRILEEPWRRPYRSEKLYVSQESWLFAVVQAPGVRVLYDYHGRVYVRLDPSFRGRVRPPASIFTLSMPMSMSSAPITKRTWVHYIVHGIQS